MELKQAAQFGQQDALDGLRGLSALLVLLGHHGLISHGYLGLSILNGLSGFLVTRRLIDELEFTGGIDFQKFYLQRARRILPAFLVSVGFVRMVFNTPGLWSTLLFVNNWVLALNGNLGELTPTWALSQEIQFYFIWPLILRFLWARRPPAQALINQVILFTAFLGIFIPMGMNPSWASWGYFSPFVRFGEILTGCVAALAWYYKSDFCISSFFAWIILPLQYWIATRVDCPMTFRLFLVCFLTNIMILYLVQHANSHLAQLLSIGSLRYVGKISYSLFLFGEPIRHVVTGYVLRASLVTPLSLICAVLVAVISWTYVESPFRLKRTDELNDLTVVTKEFTKPL
jgi:peptidoglycan/LPS O-acetylase OafA/YrhL